MHCSRNARSCMDGYVTITRAASLNAFRHVVLILCLFDVASFEIEYCELEWVEVIIGVAVSC